MNNSIKNTSNNYDKTYFVWQTESGKFWKGKLIFI